jgi:squalene cyclase
MDIERAIARGRQMVLHRQRPDGSWDERGDMGPLTTAMTIVTLQHLGQLSPVDFVDGVRWLQSRQRSDGSFPGRPFADEGDLSTTAAAWAALHLSPRVEDRAAAARAREFVEAHGGLGAVVDLVSEGDVSALLLAMAGLLDPQRIPCVPLSIVLVPRLVELLSQRVSFFAISAMLQVSAIVRGLRGEAGQRGLFRAALAERENARAVQLLTLYQNRSGSLMNVVYYTALLLPALHALGVPTSDPRIANGVTWLRARGRRDADGLHFDVYGSDVWSTASYVRVLLATGSSRSDDAVVAAVRWLLAQQCTTPHPVLTNRKPGAPRTGGWGFQSNEDAYPDCDTTAAVTFALGRAIVASPGEVPLPPELATRVCAAIAAARAWLLSMQNPDGGWP